MSGLKKDGKIKPGSHTGKNRSDEGSIFFMALILSFLSLTLPVHPLSAQEPGPPFSTPSNKAPGMPFSTPPDKAPVIALAFQM
jgi:hypothetical protein